VRVRYSVMIVLATLVAAADAQAQRASDAFRAVQDTARDARPALRPMRVAKWATFLASTGAAAYGFTQNRVADRDYEELERECDDAPASCTKASGSEAYLNPALEQRYQRILDRDETAKVALLAGQIGIAASVIMFIVDLPDREEPEDIPYEPKPMRFGLSGDGRAELNLRVLRF
jgi:hypothetical protein